MMNKLMLAVAILALGASATAVLAQRQGTNTVSAKGRYLPEYTKEGDLILPKNWRSWVYLGSPLTPDGLNDIRRGSPNTTACTSNQDPTRSTRRPASFPTARSCSKNYSGSASPAISRRFAFGTFGQGLLPGRI